MHNASVVYSMQLSLIIFAIQKQASIEASGALSLATIIQIEK